MVTSYDLYLAVWSVFMISLKSRLYFTDGLSPCINMTEGQKIARVLIRPLVNNLNCKVDNNFNRLIQL